MIDTLIQSESIKTTAFFLSGLLAGSSLRAEYRFLLPEGITSSDALSLLKKDTNN
jgi:hypothetical protein